MTMQIKSLGVLIAITTLAGCSGMAGLPKVEQLEMSEAMALMVNNWEDVVSWQAELVLYPEQQIVQEASASGAIKIKKAEENYLSMVSLRNLPLPRGTDRYEFWIREKDGEWLRLGSPELLDERWVLVNLLTDFEPNNYEEVMMTLEQNDSEEGPSQPVLRGDLLPTGL